MYLEVFSVKHKDPTEPYKKGYFIFLSPKSNATVVIVISN